MYVTNDYNYENNEEDPNDGMQEFTEELDEKNTSTNKNEKKTQNLIKIMIAVLIVFIILQLIIGIFIGYTFFLRKGLKKKLIEFSIKGWVGVSGGGQILLKIKNMPLKPILGYFKPL